MPKPTKNKPFQYTYFQKGREKTLIFAARDDALAQAAQHYQSRDALPLTVDEPANPDEHAFMGTDELIAYCQANPPA